MKTITIKPGKARLHGDIIYDWSTFTSSATYENFRVTRTNGSNTTFDDMNVTTQNLSIVFHDTSITVSANDANVNIPTTITATLVTTNTSTPVTNEPVTFTISGVNYTATTNNNGVATLEWTPPTVSNSVTVQVGYKGNHDKLLVASTSTTTFKVTKSTASMFIGTVNEGTANEEMNIPISLRDILGNTITTGTLKLMDTNNTILSTATVSSERTLLPVTPISSGNFTYTVEYTSTAYNVENKNVTITAAKRPVTIDLSQLNPIEDNSTNNPTYTTKLVVKDTLSESLLRTGTLRVYLRRDQGDNTLVPNTLVGSYDLQQDKIYNNMRNSWEYQDFDMTNLFTAMQNKNLLFYTGYTMYCEYIGDDVYANATATSRTGAQSIKAKNKTLKYQILVSDNDNLNISTALPSITSETSVTSSTTKTGCFNAKPGQTIYLAVESLTPHYTNTGSTWQSSPTRIGGIGWDMHLIFDGDVNTDTSTISAGTETDQLGEYITASLQYNTLAYFKYTIPAGHDWRDNVNNISLVLYLGNNSAYWNEGITYNNETYGLRIVQKGVLSHDN